MKKSILASELKPGMALDKAVDHPVISVHHVSKDYNYLFNRMDVVGLASSGPLVYPSNKKVVILT